jgi:septal ring factor EnvC (AmiA/AmiB activator)
VDAQTSLLVELEEKRAKEARELRREIVSLAVENAKLELENKELHTALAEAEKEAADLRLALAERDAVILRMERGRVGAENPPVADSTEGRAADGGEKVTSDDLVRKWRNGEGADEWKM